jgi:hypothetical protein
LHQHQRQRQEVISGMTEAHPTVKDRGVTIEVATNEEGVEEEIVAADEKRAIYGVRLGVQTLRFKSAPRIISPKRHAKTLFASYRLEA